MRFLQGTFTAGNETELYFTSPASQAMCKTPDNTWKEGMTRSEAGYLELGRQREETSLSDFCSRAALSEIVWEEVLIGCAWCMPGKSLFNIMASGRKKKTLEDTAWGTDCKLRPDYKNVFWFLFDRRLESVCLGIKLDYFHPLKENIFFLG